MNKYQRSTVLSGLLFSLPGIDRAIQMAKAIEDRSGRSFRRGDQIKVVRIKLKSNG